MASTASVSMAPLMPQRADATVRAIAPTAPPIMGEVCRNPSASPR
ncbi:MAG: hypothetical protein R2878_08790 [Thermoleophilia bacterium]